MARCELHRCRADGKPDSQPGISIVAGASAHVPALRAMLALPEVALPYLGAVWAPARLDQLVADRWSGRPERGRVQITAYQPDDGLVVGAASLAGSVLSYFVAPTHWGQGIATRMIRHLRDHPAAGQAEAAMTAMIYRENTASIALVEKLGFRFMGLKLPANAAFAGRAMLKYVLPSGVFADSSACLGRVMPARGQQDDGERGQRQQS
jgi:RimJ/RimL family protein N-acetyltransferase